MGAMAEHALPYHEPSITVILILISLLLLLNIVGHLLDNLVFCGLLGQLVIGIAWVTPGGQWLSTPMQEVFVQLGYLGLILLVYEGGLSTNFKALKSNLILSVLVALTGIVAPIAMSFVLTGLLDATPLQAFAAGAALCSTSLGTTFTVLKTSGLTKSRLGVVLTSAAMLDDVVGLVMVQIISNQGASPSFDAITVVRPLCVSIAFAVAVPLLCWLAVEPLSRRMIHLNAVPQSILSKSHTTFLVHTTILIGFVVASSYAGTSNLFAAYLAGASISWYDGEISALPEPPCSPALPAATAERVVRGKVERKALNEINDRHKMSSQNEVAANVTPKENVPIEPQMLPSPVVSENGDLPDTKVENMSPDNLINSRADLSNQTESPEVASVKITTQINSVTGMSTWERYYEIPVSAILKPFFFASIGFSIPISQMFTGSVFWRGIVYAFLMALGKLVCGFWLVRFSRVPAPTGVSADRSAGQRLPKPKSLYPASILGCAMVARGEIGFLISAVAESRGIFSSVHNDGSSELFLVVTWAIMLCTIAGPVAVGLLTKRVRRLQNIERGNSERKENPLGI